MSSDELGLHDDTIVRIQAPERHRSLLVAIRSEMEESYTTAAEGNGDP